MPSTDAKARQTCASLMTRHRTGAGHRNGRTSSARTGARGATGSSTERNSHDRLPSTPSSTSNVCTSPTATSPPSVTSPSRCSAASSTRCWARTEPARRPPWRSSRATGRAASGTVRIFGESPQDRRAVRPRMGIMLQESGFSGDLTVRESVGSDRRAERTAATTSTGCSASPASPARRAPGSPSCPVARSVAWTSPRPSTAGPSWSSSTSPRPGLDIQSRDALWAAVDRLRDEGSTIVLTTHYLEEAQQRADRIGLMHEGTLRREGTVAELTQALPSVITLRAAARRARAADRRCAQRRASTSRRSTCRTTSTGCWAGRTTPGVELRELAGRPHPPRRRLPRPRRRLNPRADPDPHHAHSRPRREPPPCSRSLAVS